MRLRKTLYVNNQPVQLDKAEVRLSLRSPGRAIFQVQSETVLSGHVRFEIGYTAQERDLVYFTGLIRTSETVNAKQQRLRCRELTSVLYAPMPVALRHPTLLEVVQWYTKRTGLRFVVPDREYAHRIVPAFYALGDGFHGLNSIGAVFGIEDYIWQQQGDGQVFVGSWKDSRWATRPAALSEGLFDKVTATGGRQSVILPQLRPGVVLNGKYVASTQIEGQKMVTTCSDRL
ncbi:MAG: hypothetical protein CL942_08220 [Desulfovibrio sp.]|nr:hypothetical protein [Desulfovibrio sp.]|tara:strand:- start:1551 stop:2243 length:693 start_codon:yes stop_codon:yes gene_type:complete